MFEFNTMPKRHTVKVYLYTTDGKIDTHQPFQYFYGNSKVPIPRKDIPKEWRIKLKRNKKMNEYSYTFHFDPIHKEYFFFTPLEGKNMYRIIKMIYEYNDEKNSKLQNLKLIYENIATGSIKIREYKQ